MRTTLVTNRGSIFSEAMMAVHCEANTFKLVAPLYIIDRLTRRRCNFLRSDCYCEFIFTILKQSWFASLQNSPGVIYVCNERKGDCTGKVGGIPNRGRVLMFIKVIGATSDATAPRDLRSIAARPQVGGLKSSPSRWPARSVSWAAVSCQLGSSQISTHLALVTRCSGVGPCTTTNLSAFKAFATRSLRYSPLFPGEERPNRSWRKL